jgi:hypothetical protein
MYSALIPDFEAVSVFACGVLKLDEKRFLQMTWGQYTRLVVGWKQEDNNRWRHTRLIVGALTGTDPRRIIKLPGDYDNLEAMSNDEIIEILEYWGMKEKWLN